MKQKNYQVIKGRGIAFIDEKWVYVKGSSLGYSMATIQKILRQSQALKDTIISIQQQRDNSIKKQLKSYSLLHRKGLSKELITGMNKISEILANPVIINDNVPYDLIKKKKKHLSI